MTVLVAILCTDGIVIGADSCATTGDETGSLAENPAIKIGVVKDKILVATAGEVGLGQRIVDKVEHLHYQFDQNPPQQVANKLTQVIHTDFEATSAYREVRQELDDGSYTLVQRVYDVSAFVAWAHGDRPYLVELGGGTLQPEFKGGNLTSFASLGSGTRLSEPFLAFARRAFRPDGADDLWQPKVPMGMFLAAFTIDHVVEANPGLGVGGDIRIATIREHGGVWRAELADNELAEHKAMIDTAYNHFRDLPAKFEPSEAPELPI